MNDGDGVSRYEQNQDDQDPGGHPRRWKICLETSDFTAEVTPFSFFFSFWESRFGDLSEHGRRAIVVI